jgi:hypothetical protein
MVPSSSASLEAVSPYARTFSASPEEASDTGGIVLPDHLHIFCREDDPYIGTRSVGVTDLCSVPNLLLLLCPLFRRCGITNAPMLSITITAENTVVLDFICSNPDQKTSH